MRANIGFIPIRSQLTIVLVLLTAGLAASLTFISHRAAQRSLEEDAIASLETIADSRVDALKTFVAHKNERLISVTKSVEFACGASGIMNAVCATEILRPFVRQERARGVRLTFGKGRYLVLGDFFKSSTCSANAVDFYGNGKSPFFRMAHADEESGLMLEADFAITQIQQLAASEPARNVEVVVPGEPDGLRRLVAVGTTPTKSAVLNQCLDRQSNWALEDENGTRTYRVYRFVPGIAGCVIAEEQQAAVMAPIARLTQKLTKTVVAFVIGSMLIAYLLGYVLTHALVVMKKRVTLLKQGDFDSPFPTVGTGEIRDFSQTLGSMAASLKMSRLALIESDRKLMLACRAASLWIWEYDGHSKKVVWQEPATAGAEPRSMSLRQVLHSVDERDRRIVVAAIRVAKQTGVFEVEYRPKKCAAESWISVWGHTVSTASGQPASFAGVSLDATSRKQTQALVNEREKLLAKSELAASLSHEINNPLSSVLGSVYMASSCPGVAGDPRLMRFLQIAREETDRVARIARQMLALYREPPNPESIDLRNLIKEVVAACRTNAERKKQTVNLEVDYPGSILGFADELRHAFMNLVMNAVEHSPEGRAIHIRVRRSLLGRAAERGVRILVANEGEPMLPSEEVFAPFIGTKQQKGTGLGLFVVRSVVLKHGGSVRLRSFGKRRANVCCMIALPVRPPAILQV